MALLSNSLPSSNGDDMDIQFARLVETLAPKLEQLVTMKPLQYGRLPLNMPEKGVYLFSDGRKHLYIGRSNVLRKRYYRHFQSRYGATFAFLLARKETGRLLRSYKKGDDSREGLMADPTFSAAIGAAKLKMRDMNYRYVEEKDQVSQALLEIYCAVVLKTPFNDFGTH
jgi:predicted GIY-YIG superfamily endonuclease